jgi:hypothetical protein
VAQLENDVTVVVNSYGVVSPIPDSCKSDISECNFIEEFVRISKLEFLCEGLGEISYYLRHFFKFITNIVCTILQYDTVVYLTNMYMFFKRLLPALNELVKLTYLYNVDRDLNLKYPE